METKWPKTMCLRLQMIDHKYMRENILLIKSFYVDIMWTKKHKNSMWTRCKDISPCIY